MAQYINDPRTGRLVPATEAVGAPAVRSRLDNWSYRNRPRADATLGYSRFVRIMKVMLPLVAFSLIVLVVVYSTTGGNGSKVSLIPGMLNELSNDRQLVAPKLTGTDGRGQPFTVTSKSATQAPGKARKMTFDSVVADVTMQDKSWVQVDAHKGLLDGEGQTLDLTETINIFSDKGYECHTNSARYDLRLGLLKGEEPINCQGPLGLISGKKFEGLRDPGIMRFTGGVTTTYFPTPREGKAAAVAVSNPEGIAEAVPDDPDAAFDPNAKPGMVKQTPAPTAPVQSTAPVQPAATAPVQRNAPVQPKPKPATP